METKRDQYSKVFVAWLRGSVLSYKESCTTIAHFTNLKLNDTASLTVYTAIVVMKNILWVYGSATQPAETQI